MTSQINPNNIDGAYPVAGQDNNSQGFRDNFTSTKVNFQYAADEITELQLSLPRLEEFPLQPEFQELQLAQLAVVPS